MFEVFFPVSFVFATIWIVEGTFSVSLAQLPVTDISIPKELVVGGAIEPDVSTEATLEVVFPISFIFFVAAEPMHGSLTVSFIVGPLTFVEVATGIGHLTFAPLHASLPLSFIHWAILVRERTLTVPHSINPFSLVFNTFLLVDVLAFAMSEPILDLALIGWAIWPPVAADTSDLVAVELALVHGLVSPVELPLAMQKAVLELTLVRMAISKLAGTLAMVDFADLKKKKKWWETIENTYLSVLFVVDDVSSPVLDDQLGQLRWQERYFWKWFDFHFIASCFWNYNSNN